MGKTRERVRGGHEEGKVMEGRKCTEGQTGKERE